MQDLGASAADQAALLDVERNERTESSPVCESVPSDNAAAQGNSPVGVKSECGLFLPMLALISIRN